MRPGHDYRYRRHRGRATSSTSTTSSGAGCWCSHGATGDYLEQWQTRGRVPPMNDLRACTSPSSGTRRTRRPRSSGSRPHGLYQSTLTPSRPPTPPPKARTPRRRHRRRPGRRPRRRDSGGDPGRIDDGGRLIEMVVESVRVHSPVHPARGDPQGARAATGTCPSGSALGGERDRAQAPGVSPERPLTHDLFARTLSELGVTVQRIVVSDLADETFRARIVLELDGEAHEIDCAAKRRHRARHPCRCADLRHGRGARPGRGHPGVGPGGEAVGVPAVRELAGRGAGRGPGGPPPDEREADDRWRRAARRRRPAQAPGTSARRTGSPRRAPRVFRPEREAQPPEVAHRAQDDASAWRPSGSARGPRVVGTPTSTMLRPRRAAA